MERKGIIGNNNDTLSAYRYYVMLMRSISSEGLVAISNWVMKKRENGDRSKHEAEYILESLAKLSEKKQKTVEEVLEEIIKNNSVELIVAE